MKFQSNAIFNGTITANSVADAGTNTDKFLVLNSSGLVTYRTAAELYADIGIGSLPAGYTSTLKHAVKAGVALTKGQAVYVTSADGTNMIVGKASNASEATSSKTLGLIESSLSLNGIGNVITEGLLAGLDTTGANAAGDPVWLGTDGNLVYGLLNKPSAPAHMVFIGIVTRVNANNGEIFVKVQNGFEMGELHNYAESGVQNNDVIVWENSTSLYKPKSIATILGYTPADAARTLTINGTTYDLTANRSWTIDSTTASTRVIQKFTSTSSQTTFTITNGYTVGMVDVYVNGVKLDNATDFTASNGTTVVLTNALVAGQTVEVYKFGSQFIPNNALRVVTTFTATAGQTTFTINYSVGLIDVYYNGSCLAQSEYTATNGTSIILATACQVNDIVVVYAYNYSVGAYSGIGGSGTTNYLPKFTGASTIGDSAISDNGTTLSFGRAATFSSTIDATGTITGNGVSIGASDIRSTSGTLTLGGTTEIMRLNSTGVGIKTSSPEVDLQVGANSGTPRTMSLRYSSVPLYMSNTWTGTYSKAVLSINYYDTSNGSSSISSFANSNYAAGSIEVRSATSGSDILFNTITSVNTAPTERMRITSGGRLGIGLSDPADLLSISTNAPSLSLRYTSAGTTSNPVTSSFYFRDFNGSGGTIRGGIQLQDYSFQTSGTSMFIQVMNNSNSIINSVIISRDGTVFNYANTTTWNQQSDARVKKNINTLNNGIDTILKLNPVSFDYEDAFIEHHKWDKSKQNNNIGFIAQEFEETFPEYTFSNTEYINGNEIEDFKTINTSHLVPYLVKAVQELSAKVTALDNTNISLQAEVELLKQK